MASRQPDNEMNANCGPFGLRCLLSNSRRRYKATFMGLPIGTYTQQEVASASARAHADGKPHGTALARTIRRLFFDRFLRIRVY